MEQPEQELWLQRAETAGWSRNELRRRLGEYRRQLAPGAATVPVVLRVEVSPDREQRWRDAAAASRRELAEWMSATVDAAADAILLEHLGRVGPAPRRQRPGSRNSHHSG